MPQREPPVRQVDVVVVGAASRDVAPDEPRGWRLGGAVTYAALAIARLGLRVVAFIGADDAAAGARELTLLRDAEVDVRIVPLAHGPVFENVETPRGRVQRVLSPADTMWPSTVDLPAADSEGARGWFLAPVAAELGPEWVAAIPLDVPVALGWQGLLRSFEPDGAVNVLAPRGHPLVARADLVGVSRDDLAPESAITDVTALLAPSASLVITHGADGGVIVAPERDGTRALRRYPAIPSDRPVDVTGAGDTFLAALFAARIEPRLIGGRSGAGFDVLLAAAMASLVVEGAGLDGMPTRSAVRERMSAFRKQPRRG